MCDMRIQTAIASAQDWCTIAYAAELLGVSMRQITRYLAEGKLHGHRPRVGSRESARHKAILNVDEVLAFRDARAIVKGEASVH
jgi:predicted site-specific integrase-resolvase